MASQADILQQLACDDGQGFLYAKPLGAEEARGLLRNDALTGISPELTEASH